MFCLVPFFVFFCLSCNHCNFSLQSPSSPLAAFTPPPQHLHQSHHHHHCDMPVGLSLACHTCNTLFILLPFPPFPVLSLSLSMYFHHHSPTPHSTLPSFYLHTPLTLSTSTAFLYSNPPSPSFLYSYELHHFLLRNRPLNIISTPVHPHPPASVPSLHPVTPLTSVYSSLHPSIFYKFLLNYPPVTRHCIHILCTLIHLHRSFISTYIPAVYYFFRSSIHPFPRSSTHFIFPPFLLIPSLHSIHPSSSIVLS